MRKSVPADELLNDAFKLAYFILGDRTSSIYVAMAALDKLKVASTSQGRRTYYTPIGRHDYPAARTKVSLSDLHLLQRLVYIESELFERLLEGEQKVVRQEDLIIRYIKHLVRITTRHNSFYVTLGLCRLLYNYTTAESSEIYNLVLQDPDRIRDDYYYRSRKKRLMQEVRDRFGTLIKTQRGLRREERFYPQEESRKYANLVRECLTRFTPWQSACVLPDDLDPSVEVITQLLFEGENPDHEHQVELNRIHTLIHPGCFDRLTTTLNLDSTDERLELPFFFVSSDESRPTEDRFSPAALNEGELEAIRRYLDKNVRHRKEDRSQKLSLVINGSRLVEFTLAAASSVSFKLDDEAELLEIRSVGGANSEEEVPLAVCLLNHDESGVAPLQSSATFGMRQRLAFTVIPSSDSLNEAHRATLNLTHEQTSTAEAFLEYSRGIGRQFGWDYRARADSPDGASRMGRILLKPALATTFVVLCALSSWIYLHSRKPAIGPLPAQLEEQPDNQTSPSSPPSLDTQAERESAASRKPTGRADTQTQQPPKLAESPAEGTRAADVKPVPRMMLNIRRVYVDTLGDDSFSKELREGLLDGLRSSNRFEVVSNRDSADAVFRRSVPRPARDNTASTFGLDLVNARGQIVWSLPANPGGRSIPREPARASAVILRALLREVSKLERKK